MLLAMPTLGLGEGGGHITPAYQLHAGNFSL